MKKVSGFIALVLTIVVAGQAVLAQTSSSVETVSGLRGLALRTYCSFSGLFGANNANCFQGTRVSVGNTASVGTIGIGTPTPTQAQGSFASPTSQGGTTQPTPTTQPSIGGFPVQVSAPQVIERTVIVQGTPGPQGPAGPAGAPGPGATGAFVNVPQVFWNGGGGSSITTFSSVGTSLPGGALPGQVLATNASGTIEWQYITLPSASNTPLVLGSLSNLIAENGLTLATTSTSTTIRLGGPLLEDTKIAQDSFNFSLDRQGFGFINQGTTSVPVAGGSITNNRFTGLRAEEGTQSLFAGIVSRTAPEFPIFEVQAFDSNSGRQGYSAIANAAAQMGVTNGTTTNQVRSDFDRIRLSSVTASGSSTQITIDANGVHFGFDGDATSGGGKTYSFPRVDGAFDSFMATDGSGNVRFRTLQDVFASTSTSTLAMLPVWSTSGNTGTDPDVNFIGTLDANDFAVRTNNVERLRVASNGNVGIGTSTPMRPLTVVGSVGGTLGLFQNTNPGAPAGVSLQATRANNTLTERIGLFVNPNVSGDDRIAFHAVGTGDLWSLSKGGDLVGSLGTTFDQRNGVIPARLSVMANDTRPIAYFQNGAQTYARFVNGSGAFPQSYSVGVEAAGGTFNIIDTNANKTRLSINRNGGVQIYDRLAVGSYDFGLGNTGDAGFGRSDQAYMRYVQRAHIADPALELYDYNSQLSTRISQSSNGTPTEFNRTQRDIDFRIYGQADQNLFFADAVLNKVGIGMAPIGSQPANKLEVAGNISVRTGDRVVFENNTFADWITSAPGFNGRSLQFWTASNKRMEIDGAGNVLWNDNGTGNKTFQFRPSNGQTSDVIRMQQNPNQGTATLFSVNGLGGGYFASRVGIGTSTPQYMLDVAGNAQIGQVRISNSLAGFPSPTNAIEFFHGGNIGGGNYGMGIVAGGQTNGTQLLLTSANMDGSGQYNHHQLGRILVPGYGQAISFRAAGGIAGASRAFQWTVGDTNPGISTQYERMTLTQGGSLGIGTSTPQYRVDVAGGDINIAQGFAYRYAGTPVITANPSIGNFFFANSGNLTMTGRDNTAIGNNALRSNTNARDNTALGAESLKSNTTGGANTGLGQDTLRTNVTGSENVGVGVEALLWNVSGSRNIAIGVASFADNISGSDNLVLGYESGRGITTGSGNTIIGSNVKGLSSNLSNNIIIADGLGNRRINVNELGNVAIGTTTPSHRFHVVGGGTGLINGRVARFDNASATCYINPTSLLGIQCSSDRNLKKDVVSMDATLGALTQLKPSLFRWNADDASAPLQYGFIAQEVEEVFPSFVTTDADTGMKSVAFGNLLPVTVKSIQELNSALGDMTDKGTTESFVASNIFKRITDAFMSVTVEFKNIFAKKATVEELCLTTSSGTPVCLTGDQVVQILNNVGVQSSSAGGTAGSTGDASSDNPAPQTQPNADEAPSSDDSVPESGDDVPAPQDGVESTQEEVVVTNDTVDNADTPSDTPTSDDAGSQPQSAPVADVTPASSPAPDTTAGGDVTTS